MRSTDVLKVYRALQKNRDKKILSHPLPKNPITNPEANKRPNSISIEDGFFGDSGKGRITAEFNQVLGKNKKIYSVRYNGGANAGHECISNGKRIVVHQLPMAIIQDNATAIMARGVLLHPDDLLTEIAYIKREFGGMLPAKLLIDERALLGLDTHRALETVLNIHTTGGRGSTGRGIATGYASLYLRIAVCLKDLLSPQWRDIFSKHYQLYNNFIKGFGKAYSLETTEVVASTDKGVIKRAVGSEKEFLARLSQTRSKLTPYARSDLHSMFTTIWKDPKIPVTLEGAQGSGLDPYHGVYPDTTASRPISRHINDATYNAILPEDIALRVAVMKTTYMSSVGTRRLPHKKDEAYEKWVQEAFDEKGKSTGRLRDIYPVSLPIGQYLRLASGYDFLIATHIDAAKKNHPIQVVTHYTDKKTKRTMPYLPYQDYLDTLEPHVVSFASWDGENAKGAKTPKELPYEARVFLSFLSKTLAPVVFGTASTELGNGISWM